MPPNVVASASWAWTLSLERWLLVGWWSAPWTPQHCRLELQWKPSSRDSKTGGTDLHNLLWLDGDGPRECTAGEHVYIVIWSPTIQFDAMAEKYTIYGVGAIDITPPTTERRLAKLREQAAYLVRKIAAVEAEISLLAAALVKRDNLGQPIELLIEQELDWDNHCVGSAAILHTVGEL